MIKANFNAAHLLALVLIASAAVQLTWGALSSQQIVERLESEPRMAPDEVIRLVKQLGSSYNEAGLSVASLVDQDEVSERKCSNDKLVARRYVKSMLTLELPDSLECVLNFVDARYQQQLQLCLALYTEQLERQVLVKFRSKTRKNAELLYELNKAQEAKLNRAIMDPGDLAQLVAGQFLQVKRARRKLAGKLVNSKAGADEKIRRGLREACADVSLKLAPLVEFIGFAREYGAIWRQLNESAELKRWLDIYAHCDRHQRRQTGELDELLG